jgi:hypothetical protein
LRGRPLAEQREHAPGHLVKRATLLAVVHLVSLVDGGMTALADSDEIFHQLLAAEARVRPVVHVQVLAAAASPAPSVVQCHSRAALGSPLVAEQVRVVPRIAHRCPPPGHTSDCL